MPERNVGASDNSRLLTPEFEVFPDDLGMAESNLDERFCWPRGFTSALLPFLQSTRRNMQYLSKLYLGQTSFTPCFCHLIRFYTTGSCGFTRFHFFDGLE